MFRFCRPAVLEVMGWRRPWNHGLRPKKLYASVEVPPVPVRVPSLIPLAPTVMSVMSVASNKDDNVMISGVVCTDHLSL